MPFRVNNQALPEVHMTTNSTRGCFVMPRKGVSVTVTFCKGVEKPVTSTLLPAGMLALDGRCKTLDIGADGYVRAETCMVLLLGMLSDDMVAHAIIYGSSVRQVHHVPT
jgi:hypothetical protein